MQNNLSQVDFYFDFLSPFSYFAWKNHLKGELKGLSNFNYRPITMGKLFDHWQIKGPGEIAPKRYLMLKSCFRYASRNGIEFVPPESHPFNPLYALRLATAACSKDKQVEVIDALWDYIWARGNTADDPEALEQLLNQRGLAGKELMEEAFSREAKREIKTNTNDAIAAKVFGVPSLVHQGEIFWGNDSLEDLLAHIKNEENFDKELFRSRTSDIEF